MSTSGTTATGPVLLLADTPTGQRLASRLEAMDCTTVSDGYEVLTALADRTYATVILSPPQPELASLGRAIRRLNNSARLLAFCKPEEEDDLLRQADGVLDECRPFPPTRGEMNLLLGRLTNRATEDDSLTTLGAKDLSKLFMATNTTQALESALARRVSAALGSPVQWVNAEDCPPDSEPLLSLAGKPSRMLMTEEAADISETADSLITDLHRCLPAMTKLANRTESLHRLAITDHMTGAYNRRYFYHLTDQVLKRAGKEGFRATLLLYDIDDFKRYNDQFGHAVGDEILRDTARMMRDITRDQDIVARIGGDEFAVLFWDSELRDPHSKPLEDAWELADRFRQAVADHRFHSLGPDATGVLTISGGLASFPEHGQTCRDLLGEADRALRTAKTAGKNSICLVGQVADQPPGQS